MSAIAGAKIVKRKGKNVRTMVLSAFALLVLVAMVLDTKIIIIGSAEDIQEEVFDPDKFGPAEFPSIQASVIERAVDAALLASALAEDKAAASEKYGVAASIGPVLPVTFSGIAGEAKAGVYNVTVEGLPDNLLIRVQTGPAINGTDLRDATGNIEFGQFTNQIEYQDAGSGINRAMKKLVLDPIDNSELTGKTLTVTGVFKLINPKSWLVTPVRLDVE